MENTIYISVKEIQELYLPLGEKKLRKILNSHSDVFDLKRNGNRILVNREKFLDFLNNPNQVELN